MLIMVGAAKFCQNASETPTEFLGIHKSCSPPPSLSVERSLAIKVREQSEFPLDTYQSTTLDVALLSVSVC